MLIDKKVIILYRVTQGWRIPIFNSLGKHFKDFIVFYGPDFRGTKVVSSNTDIKFKRKKLISFKIRFKGSYSEGQTILSPFLFFLLLKERPDVVITEGKSNIFNAFQGFLYAKLFRKKFIWWSLGALRFQIKNFKNSCINKIVKFIVSNSNSIITYSSQGKNYYHQLLKVDPDKIFPAINVVDTDHWIQKYRPKKHHNERIVLLFVGHIVKEKNIELLINSFIKVNSNNEFVLNIVGDGKDKIFFENQTKSIPNLNFIGRVYEGIERYFNEADIFILPGLGGLAISHAMCFGLPIICSDGDGSERDLVKNDFNGYYIEDINEWQLVEKIEALKNIELRNKFSENSRKLILEKYNKKNYIQKILDAINY